MAGSGHLRTDRNHVWPFGDHCYGVVTTRFDAVLHCTRYRLDARDAGERMLRLIQARAVKLYAALPHGFELHLGLPFVDRRVGLDQDTPEELVGTEPDQPALCFDELCRAQAFGSFRGDNQAATGGQDVDRSDHSLYSLVVGRVQGITGRPGHNGMVLVRNRNF